MWIIISAIMGLTAEKVNLRMNWRDGEGEKCRTVNLQS
jgi:hypothetical protein